MNTCDIIIYGGLLIFLFLGAIIYDKNNKINQLKHEKFILQSRKDDDDKYNRDLREEINKKEEECDELRGKIEDLLFIFKPSDKNENITKGTPQTLEKGMTVTIFEDGIYKDLIYTGKRAKYNVWNGYFEANDGSYIFFTPESKDFLRGVKEAELDDFIKKIKSYKI